MNSYIVGDITYRIATESDELSLKKILNDNKMNSWVNITLRREPDYFAGEGLMGESVTVIAYKTEDEKEIIGMYSCSLFNLFFGGEAESIVYLNSLRVNPVFRHKIRFLKEGYVSIERLVSFDSTLPFMFTSIASENLDAKRLLESNLKGMPTYIPLSKMSTLTFSATKHDKPYLSSAATHDDIEDIVNFYNDTAKEYDFSPVLDSNWLGSREGSNGLGIEDFRIVRNSDGELEAVFALWDQRAIKQVVIESYKKPLNRLRPFYNLFAWLSGNMKLPKAGTMLEHIFISFFTTIPKDEKWTIELLREASSLIKSRGADICTIGIPTHDPLCRAIKNNLKAKEYTTDIEAVFLSGWTCSEISTTNIKPEIALL